MIDYSTFDPTRPETWIPSVRPDRPTGPFPQRPPVQPLGTEDEQGILSKVGQGALGALGYVGGVMEKTFGGRAIRGLLGGRPRELLSILPGSDVLGITDPSERVSGAELLGYSEADQKDWGPFLAGLGAELATDPGMWISGPGAALTQAGKVAKATRVLPTTAAGRVGTTLQDALTAAAATRPGVHVAAETAAGGAPQLAALMGERLGGVASVGLPLTPWGKVIGAGPGGEAFLGAVGKAGRGADWLARQVPGVGPLYGKATEGLGTLGRYATSYLDPDVLGATTVEGQQAAREASALRGDLLAAARLKQATYAQELAKGGATAEGAPLRMATELPAARAARTIAGATPADYEVAAKMRADFANQLDALRARGIDVSGLTDPFAEYAPRGITPPVGGTAQGPGYPYRALPARDPRIEGREEFLKGIPGGTESINRIVLDPKVYQAAPADAAAHIARTYGISDPEQALRMADWVRGLNPAYQKSIGTANELRFFGNHPLADYTDYFNRTSKVLAAADASHNLLAKMAVDVSQGAQPGHVGLVEALKAAGLEKAGGQQYLAGKLGLPGGTPLSNYAVPERVVAELTRLNRGFTAPENLGPVMKAFDYLTNLFKTGATSLFPAFHLRNAMSGLWQNYVKGAFEPGRDPISGFIKPILDQRALQSGGVIKDAHLMPMFRGLNLTPEQATAELAKLEFAHGIGGHAGNIFGEATLPGGQAVRLPRTLADIVGQIPGETPTTVGSALGRFGELGQSRQAWNPLNLEQFAPTRVGRGIGDVVEGINRGSLFLALLRQGYEPGAAAQHVLAAHFKYGRDATTALENTFLKRMIPFYNYQKGNIPFQLEQLVSRPGGPTATYARVAHSLAAEQPFLPPSLQGGLAMPLGETDEGKARYLGGLGLPPEQAFELLRGTGPQTGLAALAQVNPWLRLLPEWATGTQFYTGRKFAEMPGQPGLVQQAIDIPLGRFERTVGSLGGALIGEQTPLATAAQFGLGAHLRDVDLEREKFRAERQFLKEQAGMTPELRKFEKFYTPPGAENIDPETQLLLRLQQTLEARAKANAARVRAGGG